MIRRFWWPIGLFIAGLLFGLFALGCNESKRTYISGVAPVTTIVVTFLDPIPPNDRDEITEVVNNIYWNVLNDYSTTNTTNYNVNVVLNIDGDVKMNGNKFLCEPGKDNECPGLYEAFCEAILGSNHPDKQRWKNRGQQIADEHRRNR